MIGRAAIAVAAWAQANVPLYRDLYAGRPPVVDAAGFRSLPPLTVARLRAAPPRERIDTPADTLRAFTPYRTAAWVPPTAILTDTADTDAAYDESREALALLDVHAGSGAALALIAPPEQRYAAAELSDRLGYWDITAHVVVDAPGPGHDPARTLTALGPVRRIWFGPRHTAPAWAEPEVTVRDPEPVPDHGGACLYLVPEAGIVAVRPAGTDSYQILAAHYLLEPGPDGRLLLTALRRFHQPLVRYLLPDRGAVRGRRLTLREVRP